MASACWLTSSWDQRSKANRIDWRSLLNSGLMCVVKLGVVVGSGSRGLLVAGVAVGRER